MYDPNFPLGKKRLLVFKPLVTLTTKPSGRFPWCQVQVTRAELVLTCDKERFCGGGGPEGIQRNDQRVTLFL